MIPQDTCTVLDLTTSSFYVVISLIAFVDIFIREISPLIAKARATALCTLVLGFTTATLTATGANGRQTSWSIILLLPAGLATLVYFCENFLLVCLDTVKYNKLDKKRSEYMTMFVKSFPWARWFGLAYAVPLLIAFQVEPTNAVMVASHVGFLFVWAWIFAVIFVVLYLVRLIRTHTKQVKVGTARSKELKSLVYQMIAFSTACTILGMTNLYLDGFTAAALAKNPHAQWVPPMCRGSFITFTATFVATTLIFYLTRSPHAKRRSWSRSSKFSLPFHSSNIESLKVSQRTHASSVVHVTRIITQSASNAKHKRSATADYDSEGHVKVVEKSSGTSSDIGVHLQPLPLVQTQSSSNEKLEQSASAGYESEDDLSEVEKSHGGDIPHETQALQSVV